MKETVKTTPRRSFELFGRTVSIPRSRLGRQLLGWALIGGGLVGFLPIVGFWMIPLGLGVLSIDNPLARRYRRSFVTWAGRRWPGLVKRGGTAESDEKSKSISERA